MKFVSHENAQNGKTFLLRSSLHRYLISNVANVASMNVPNFQSFHPILVGRWKTEKKTNFSHLLFMLSLS